METPGPGCMKQLGKRQARASHVGTLQCPYTCQETEAELGFSLAPFKDSLGSNPVTGPRSQGHPVPEEESQPSLKPLPARMMP